jgi:DNA-binding CsgD family transcriptional regulator
MAPGTARKHIENIHRKLDTHGPVGTLRRARELGLPDQDEG